MTNNKYNSVNIDLDIDNLTNDKMEETPASTLQSKPVSSPQPDENATTDPTFNNGAGTNNNPNDITITDTKSPVILLFGPRSSGKSMTLVRLSRYLRKLGYTIVADINFLPGPEYKERCRKFMESLDTNEALPGNAYNDFLLIKVYKHGRTICQFLEAPGEHYFDIKDTSAANFPSYMTRIIHSFNNRKIWAFITEANWDTNRRTKAAYVERIRNCKNMLMRSTDRSIIIYNKVDRKTELFEGKFQPESAKTEMIQEYNGITTIFKNPNPITSLWRQYNYTFVPFCTGYYTKEQGKLTYNSSEDFYPAWLWSAFMKSIKG